ncbi:hydroxymethylbilane synthase [Candidatus Sumerlaeota bacterium]|nr:hydroxymethylbilane synthase [Candidatus Sumerlaeota bacterium]
MSPLQRDQGRPGTGSTLNRIRIGTRGSRLALTQAHLVGDHLRRAHPDFDIHYVIIQTTGDRLNDTPLGRIGGKGVFTKEIEDALLEDRIDIAVHSFKDLPTRQPDGLMVGAVMMRESPADMLIAMQEIDWKSLAKGTRLGTSSVRRRAQVNRLNQDVQILEIRGNVPTRVQKVLDGTCDAVIVAAAGIHRLSLEAPFMQLIPFDEMLPAPGQGALAIEVRRNDAAIKKLIGKIHHQDTADCCVAERAFLHALGGGCQFPLGALATLEGDKLRLRARVTALDGKDSLEDELSGDRNFPVELGAKLADRMLARGANTLLERLTRADEENMERVAQRSRELDSLPLGNKTVLVTRDEDSDGPLSNSLRSLGAHPICVPFVRHIPMDHSEEFGSALEKLNLYDWMIFTSYRAVHIIVENLQKQGKSLRNVLPQIACVGKATALAVDRAGGRVHLVPPQAQLSTLLASLLKEEARSGAKVFYPRADLASPILADGLRKGGMNVDDIIVYRTERIVGEGLTTASIAATGADAILFCSPSAVETLHDSFMQEQILSSFGNMVIGSIGPRTTEALEAVGLKTSFEPEERSFGGLARGLAEFYEKKAGAVS